MTSTFHIIQQQTLHPMICIIHDIFPHTRYALLRILQSAHFDGVKAYSVRSLQRTVGHDLVSNFPFALPATFQVCVEHKKYETNKFSLSLSHIHYSTLASKNVSEKLIPKNTNFRLNSLFAFAFIHILRFAFKCIEFATHLIHLRLGQLIPQQSSISFTPSLFC